MTIRMLVEPQFDVDMDLLTTTLADESARKQAMLLECADVMGIRTTDMSDEDAAQECLTVSSANKFAMFLEALRIDVPTKISPTTGKEIPALARRTKIPFPPRTPERTRRYSGCSTSRRKVYYSTDTYSSVHGRGKCTPR